MERAPVQGILVAAGSGSRMKGVETRKPWLPLGGRTVLEHACAALRKDPRVGGSVLVVHADDLAKARELAERGTLEGVSQVVVGGASRSASVRNGVQAATSDYVAIHDAARPCLGRAALGRVLDAALEEGAALLALRVRDTLKRERAGKTVETVDRSDLWLAQTPQVFLREKLLPLLERALAEDLPATDDVEIWQRYFEEGVRLVEGDATNLKITYPEDLALAERLLLEATS